MRAIVLASTALVMASVALASTDPVADTRQIMAGTVTTTSVKKAYLSGARDGTAAFQGALKAYKAVRAAETPAPPPPVLKWCAGGIQVPSTEACPPAPAPAPVPAPAPTPVPAPAPLAGWVDSPTLAGAPDFVQPFDVYLGLGKSWGTGAIPALESGGGVEPNGSVGAFRFTCDGDGQLNRDDMLVYPNQPGKAHGHYYWGNLLTNSNPDEARLKTAKTNCNKGNYPLNLSSYWMPWLEDDQGNVRLADLISAYYKRPSLNSVGCVGPKAEGICVGLPNRIRYVMGWDATKPDALPPISRAYWYCTKGTGLHYSNLDDLFNLGGCTAGAQMIGDTTGYPCWDGKHLDSPDHRSHMAPASYGSWGFPKCPDTHPYRIPTQENKATFTVTEDMIGTRPDGTKYSRVRLSSDHMKANAKPGETLHADYEEMWDARAKAMWVGNCVDKGLNCSGGDFGNGWQMAGAAQPKYGWVMPNARVPVPN